ncbi:MAG: type II secretion system protein [Candidatus Firestonebacteria bacterium]
MRLYKTGCYREKGKKMISYNNKGYTLVEMMVSIAVLGMMGTIVSVFYLQIYKSYSKTDAKTKVTQIAIASLSSVQKQLREIAQQPTFTPNTTLHPTAVVPVSFYIPSLTDPTTRSSDDKIDYYLGTYSGKNVFLQKLTRGAVQYTAFPVTFDFDSFRAHPDTVPRSGGISAFLNDPTLKFDDVSFYYDNTYNMICVGIIVSIADKGKSGTRESLTLTSAIAIRNTF